MLFLNPEHHQKPSFPPLKPCAPQKAALSEAFHVNARNQVEARHENTEI